MFLCSRHQSVSSPTGGERDSLPESGGGAAGGNIPTAESAGLGILKGAAGDYEENDDDGEDNANVNDDEDDGDDGGNEEPCDLRLLTPATCLREYPSMRGGDFHGSPTLVPFLGAATMMSEIAAAAVAAASFKSEAGCSGTSSIPPPSSSSASATLSTMPALRTICMTAGSSATASSSSSSTTTAAAAATSHLAGGSGSNQTTPGGAYTCNRCGNSYARPHSLNRHIRFECGVEPKFECPVCHKKSKHKHNLVLHMRTHQQR